mgnify:CR=1 FL=1
MQPIIAPIVPNAKGKEVQNLQNALSFFLDKNMIRSFDPPNQPTTDDLLKLRKLLQAESTETVFGTGTTQLVVYFQLQQKLGDNLKGMVEETTAGKMNELLKQWGGLYTTNSNRTYTVSGTIDKKKGSGMPGVIEETMK